MKSKRNIEQLIQRYGLLGAVFIFLAYHFGEAILELFKELVKKIIAAYGDNIIDYAEQLVSSFKQWLVSPHSTSTTEFIAVRLLALAGIIAVLYYLYCLLTNTKTTIDGISWHCVWDFFTLENVTPHCPECDGKLKHSWENPTHPQQISFTCQACGRRASSLTLTKTFYPSSIKDLYSDYKNEIMDEVIRKRRNHITQKASTIVFD